MGQVFGCLGTNLRVARRCAPLASGRASAPVRHRTVQELRYVVDGHGEIARRHGDRDPFIDELKPGACVDVGTGITFQFRALGDHNLTLLLLTMPAWPGSDEAVGDPERAVWSVERVAS